MQHSGRSGVKHLSPIIASAAVITTIAALPALLQKDESPPPPPKIVLSDYLPVADDEGVAYEATVIPGTDEIVSSVGVSDENLIATTEGETGDDLDSISIYDGSEEIASWENVRGIALSDPSGTLSAWIERTETATEYLTAVVAVDTTTGDEVGRLSVSETTNVMAVRGDTVALSDGTTSQLWTLGSAAQPVPFVPDKSIIVGLTEDHVVSASPNGDTSIFDRTTGTEVFTLHDLVSWDTNIDGDLLVSATEQGDVRQVELATGASTLIDTSIDAATAAFSENDSIVVHDVTMLQPAPEHVVNVCVQDQPCESITTDTAPLVPNDAIGQLGSQSQ